MLVCRHCDQPLASPQSEAIPETCPNCQRPLTYRDLKHKDDIGQLLQSHGKVLATGALALLIFLAVVAIRFDLLGDGHRMAELNAKYNEWLKVPSAGYPEQAYLRGRVLPVNRRGKYPSTAAPGVDAGFYRALPGDLRARSPDEVDMVLLLDWHDKNLVTRNGLFQYDWFQSCCEITLIDRRDGKRLAKTSFQGPNPVGTDKANGDKPYDKMLSYILGLPRKQ
jgi:hypothetical protein